MAQHVFSGAGAPASTPTAIGQHYIDTTNGASYISVGTTSSSHWETSDAAAAIAAHVAAGDPHTQYAETANNLSDLASASTARTNLGLGTAAVQNTGDFDAAGSAAAAQSFAIQRSNHTGTQLASTISDLSSQVVANVSGVVAIANGGTGQSNATAALNNLLPSQTGNNGKVLSTDGSNSSWVTPSGGGAWGSITGTLSDQTDLQAALDAKLFISVSPDFEPNGLNTTHQYHVLNGQMKPLQASPDEAWDLVYLGWNIDPDSSGFAIGTNGDAAYLLKQNIVHNGTADVGRIGHGQFNFSIGNGTDPITVKGIGYQFGFGNVAANVTITDYIQGYGFQPNLNAATVMNGYINAFYDTANIACDVPSYQSFNASPTIASMQANNGYTSYNSNPQFTSLIATTGANCFASAGNVGTIDSGASFQGWNHNPTVTLNKGYVAGFNVNLDNVTNYAGVGASLVEQDITYEFYEPGTYNNSYTMEYVDDGTAGSETFSIAGFAIQCHMEAGVSTATQIAAAAALNLGLIGDMSVTITGVGSNTQIVAGPTNFTGGEDAGTKECYIKGDLRIDGGLSFTGGLSVGALNAFASQAISSGSGTPVSIHTLITNPTIAANATVTLADTLGVNTAMLLNIGANATVTTGFLGMQALGLPAVVTLGAGATVDVVGGAAFALSLDAAAGGGTIDVLNLCSALALPNGVTTVNKSRGYYFDMPFGDVGTDMWCIYSKPAAAHNYIAGDLVVGPTDLPTNASVGIEINSTTKALLLSRLTSAQEAALTAVNGLVIYNTDTNKFRGYENGAWVDLV